MQSAAAGGQQGGTRPWQACDTGAKQGGIGAKRNVLCGLMCLACGFVGRRWKTAGVLSGLGIAPYFGDSFNVTGGDGDGMEIVKQYIPFSDFPFNKVKLYLSHGCLMLPSEY